MSKTPRTFRDRREAGRVLAQDLARYRGRDDLLVLGLARGGVPVGWEVASFLHAPLDVCLVRKLGVPHWPELAMGAVATAGGVVLNDDLLRSLDISDDQVRDAVTRETAELHRRELAYRAGRGPLTLSGRTVILVDDGIATGASMIAAVRVGAAIRRGPDRRGGAGRACVGLPAAARRGRRRGVLDDAGPLQNCRRSLRGFPPGQRRGSARPARHTHRRARTRRRKPLSRGGSALRSVVGCRLPAQVLFKG